MTDRRHPPGAAMAGRPRRCCFVCGGAYGIVSLMKSSAPGPRPHIEQHITSITLPPPPHPTASPAAAAAEGDGKAQGGAEGGACAHAEGAAENSQPAGGSDRDRRVWAMMRMG